MAPSQNGYGRPSSDLDFSFGQKARDGNLDFTFSQKASPRSREHLDFSFSSRRPTHDILAGAIPAGIYTLESVNAPGKYLNVLGDEVSNGTTVHLWDNFALSGSHWFITECDDGMYTLQSILAEGKYLSVEGSQVGNGTQVRIWEDENLLGSQWRIGGTKGVFNIENVNAVGKYLNVFGAGVSNGTQVILWDDPLEPQTQWRLKLATPPISHLWGVDREGSILRRPIDANWFNRRLGDELESEFQGSALWMQVGTTGLSGKMSHVSVGNGWVWAVNSSGNVFKSQLSHPGTWKHVDGSLVQIDAGADEVWGVNSYGGILHRPVDGSGSWTTVPDHGLSGQITCVSVGTGWAWALNERGDVFKSSLASPGNWTQLDGNLSQICANRFEVWGVNSHGDIFHRPVDGSGRWVGVGKSGLIGLISYVSTGRGWVWAINTDGNVFESHVSSAWLWTPVYGSALVQIDADPSEGDGYSIQAVATVSDRKYLSHVHNRNGKHTIELSTHAGSNQTWRIFFVGKDEYTIQAVQSHGGKTYLTHDGYHSLDLSVSAGTYSKWYIVSAGKGEFTIMAVSNTSAGRRYLSHNGDLNSGEYVVDLWKEPGMYQKWRIPGFRESNQAPQAPPAASVHPEFGNQFSTPGRPAAPEPKQLASLGWYRADSGRLEAADRAKTNLIAIATAVDEFRRIGRVMTGRWTNDPHIVPDLTFPSVTPFFPNDKQLRIPDLPVHQAETLAYGYDDEESTEDEAETGVQEEFDRRPHWLRLCEFGGGMTPTHCVFDETVADATNFGRVYRGQLDNTYLVEALNAISLRPALARQLFYGYDVMRSIYIVRLFKNGVWMHVEIDDFVPTATPDGERNPDAPFCCRSEYFPYVLWPSLVEKAYAKVCTLRNPRFPEYDSGGWNAIGGGGQVEEALADLTGGVAGRFFTHDVSPDRLFIYLHSLQRDCLFVCRVNAEQTAKRGVHLNPFACHSVNRVVSEEGHGFVQVFCACETGVYDGGLSDLTVPPALLRKYPERSSKGFFWLCIEDFHQYFDTIFECRLTNSPDIGLELMPVPRLPNAFNPAAPQQPMFFETVFANPGEVTERSPPEVSVRTPDLPCEVVVTVQQTDSRITQVGPDRKRYVPILMKVYESLDNSGAQLDLFSPELTCKSNWLPIRDSMVAFSSAKGGFYRIMVEMPRHARCDKLIVRCYSSVQSVAFHVSPSYSRHRLGIPQGPPRASRASLVGTVDRSRLALPNVPEPLDEDLDAVKSRHKDRQCAVM
eukprot:TRINITY_DN23344_c0_g1_i1.p1 TRINITY_DN23344_c0_g1~~TRINITY_DN23344_c0_g1_i1.p1  ORF type:complete len:1255 (-),score=151.43 TRINITY_DN23344_c0_g1_i1:69-3833(-)